jgi:hypothetical protein
MGMASAAPRADVPGIPVPNSGISEIIWEFPIFEQQWTDQASGRALPKFVADELHKYLVNWSGEFCTSFSAVPPPTWHVAPAMNMRDSSVWAILAIRVLHAE